MDVETVSIEELEKLIREETARSGGTDELATALIRLWRKGEIAVYTRRDGVLVYYIPHVA